MSGDGIWCLHEFCDCKDVKIFDFAMQFFSKCTHFIMFKSEIEFRDYQSERGAEIIQIKCSSSTIVKLPPHFLDNPKFYTSPPNSQNNMHPRLASEGIEF